MKRNERKRKFHDSLVNMLYPPPSPPSPENQFDEQTFNLAREIVHSDHHRINTDEFNEQDERSVPASSEEESGLGSKKLTRAQRKRLRKKKLKEAASHRRHIIGPQLLTTDDDQIDSECSEQQHPEGVRRNVAEASDIGSDHNHRGETPSCIKVKHRRLSKKRARDKPNTPPSHLSHENEPTTPGEPN